jgi:hypothetical protein
MIRNLSKAAKAKWEIARRESQDSSDRRELARAKKCNGGKPGVDWETVKTELRFNFSNG